ncbi:MlaD family protein [Klebsiella aerogenes]|uniref:MlaD family protein n=1 Tax=Klebsiella aerogenes TaxID=548 RepID=UPI0012FD104C
MQTKKNEIWVGVFLLAALLAALFVCLKAANVTSLRTEPTYRLYATFDNIGGLKARSPVRIGGVVVGRVADITLDPKNLSAARCHRYRRKLQPHSGYQLAGDSYFWFARGAVPGAERRF